LFVTKNLVSESFLKYVSWLPTETWRQKPDT
jgi:hypothetical protein